MATATDSVNSFSGQSKTCTKCGETKVLADFNRHGISKDGRRPDCRECQRARLRRYIKDNREAHNARSRSYYERNKDHVLAKNRAWDTKNQEKRREIALRHTRKKLATPKGRLSQRMRDSLRKALKCRGGKRKRPTFEMLGYTADDLVRHIEKHFLPGMSWDNIGEWHIDHVVPLSVFNFNSPDDIDFKRAWALSNLRPLWAIDNIMKRDRIDAPFQPSFAFSTGEVPSLPMSRD